MKPLYTEIFCQKKFTKPFIFEALDFQFLVCFASTWFLKLSSCKNGLIFKKMEIDGSVVVKFFFGCFYRLMPGPCFSVPQFLTRQSQSHVPSLFFLEASKPLAFLKLKVRGRFPAGFFADYTI